MPFCNAVDQGTPAQIIESLNFTRETPPELDEEESSSDELKMAGSSTPSFESIQIPTFYDFSDFLPESVSVQEEYHDPDPMQSHSTGSRGTPVPTDKMPPHGTPVDAPTLTYPLGGNEEGETLVSWHRWGRDSQSEKAQMLSLDQPDEVNPQAGNNWDVIQSVNAWCSVVWWLFFMNL